MNMEPWELELQDQIRDSKSAAPEPLPKNDPAPILEKAKEPSAPAEGGGSIVFFTLLVILAAVTVLVYDHKTGGKFRSWMASHFSSADQVEKVEPKRKNEADESRLRDEFDKFVASNKSQIEALQSRVGSIRDKVMLMGLLLNENFNIIKQDESKDEMVFFNSDWTLNKMPTHIDLSDEDRDYLRKYVSK